MTPAEFFDKENGTTLALRPLTYSDDQRNQMSELAGEADEPCTMCETMVRPDPFLGRFPFSLDADGQEPVCEDCYEEAREAHAEAKAEGRAYWLAQDEEDV